MTYQAINAVILQINPELTTAEVQGIAVGMLSVNEKVSHTDWLDELLANTTVVSNQNMQLLLKWFDEIKYLLTDEQFKFDLMLPDDTVELNIRLEALKSWCEGFLLGVSKVGLADIYNDEVHEILKDISEFTKLDTTAEGEEDEQAFAEVTEFLRCAVLVFREQFNDHGLNTIN